MREHQALPDSKNAAPYTAPSSRDELERVLTRCPETAIIGFVRLWLGLDDDLIRLREQQAHVRDVLGDRLLGTMLTERTDDLLVTMRRRASDLSGMRAERIEDTCCKCYVRQRLLHTEGGSSPVTDALLASIKKDLEAFQIDADKVLRSCA